MGSGQVASCGHELTELDNDGQGFHLALKAEGCDAVEGFYHTVDHGTYCGQCTAHLRRSGAVLEGDQEVEDWLRSDTLWISDDGVGCAPEPDPLSELMRGLIGDVREMRAEVMDRLWRIERELGIAEES